MRLYEVNDFLKNNNINIRTRFKDGSDFKYRNTDNSYVDDIYYGIKLDSEYYKDNKLIGKLNNFDSRIIYSYVRNKVEDESVTCKNCGYTDLGKNFIDGCPYCKTNYNIEYDDKNLGNKFTYDYEYDSSKFLLRTLLIDLVICFVISLIYILITGRTFNIYDISKVIIGGIIFGLIIFYPLYILDTNIMLAPLKKKKEEQNRRQMEFWKTLENLNVNKVTFMNNFNYEISKHVYEIDNVIDYNIEDYNEFKIVDDKNLSILVNATIRIVKLINDEIVTENISDDFLMIRAIKTGELKGGINVIMCPNCSSSIDVTHKSCDYCSFPINYLQEWYLKR